MRMPGYEGGPALRGAAIRTMSTNKVGILALRADIDPSPTPWPFAPAVAILSIVFFISLQFALPATHVRHPADPYRNWVPINQPKAPTIDKIVPDFLSKANKETLIVVMAKETDLRPIFVILNSTIWNTREPDKLHFCLIVPSSLSTSKSLNMWAVISNLNFEVFSIEFIMEKMESLMVVGRSEKIYKVLDVAPFYFPKIFPSYERFVYLESDAVVQGDIQELIQVDMEGNPIAGVEDCTQDFETYFAMNLLEDVRLSLQNGKPQLPVQPYEPKTCLFDRGTLVIDRKVWSEMNITESVDWWIAMYHKTEESLYSNAYLELPFYLALYEKYKKLDASWSVREPLALARANAAKLFHFDKQHKPWHQTKPTHFEDITRLWWKYLSPATNRMFISNEQII